MKTETVHDTSQPPSGPQAATERSTGRPLSSAKLLRAAAALCLVAVQLVFPPAHADTLVIQNQFNVGGVFDFKKVQPIDNIFDVSLPSPYYGSVRFREVTFDIVKIGMTGAPAPVEGLVQGYLRFLTARSGGDFSPYSGPGFRSVYVVDSTPSYYTPGANTPPNYVGPVQIRPPEPRITSALPIDPNATRFAFRSLTNLGGGRCYLISDACLERMAGTLEAQYFVKMTESVTYDLSEQSFAHKIKTWIEDNVPTSHSDFKRLIRQKVSEHFEEDVRKGLWIPRLRPSGSNGIRGSVDFIGTSVFTASPGVLSYDITLSTTDNILSVPLAFTRNNLGSFVDIYFDDRLMQHVKGDDYNLDELQIIDLDVSALKGRQGTLSFVINTNGPGSAEIFVPDSIAGTSLTLTDPSLPVPEPQSWAMTLLGLAGIGLWVRGRKRLPCHRDALPA